MHILLLGTLDTKHAEILYLHHQLKHIASRLSQPLQITLIDCGCSNTIDEAITVTHSDLIKKYAPSSAEIRKLPRGEAVELLIGYVTRCVQDLLKIGPIHGIIGAGGSGGTSIISAVMRSTPIGLPKLIASTVASGNTSPIVGECDITLMYSVVDIAGTNGLLRDVLDNAAGAMFGMASAYQCRVAASAERQESQIQKTRVGITMFGVTTPCVDRIRSHLEENYPVEVYIFHATGHGGKAMERLVEEGRLDAILDVTTTEICDLVAGGTMSCEPDRLDTMLKKGIPTIISAGATDMVNFGPKETVPPQYQDRKLVVHNPTVTLMRTSPDECRKVGEFIVDKVKRFAQDQKRVEVWLPRGGVSVLATPGSPFEDSEADSVLADAVKSGLKDTETHVVCDDRDINNSGFAVDIANRLMDMVKASNILINLSSSQSREYQQPTAYRRMAEIPEFRNLSLERHGNVFVLTMQKPPENKLSQSFCQEMIQAFRTVESILGSKSEGALITRSGDDKFWCTLIHTILDFSFPTIALLNGHTFGAACLLALAHDFRVMNTRRGFMCLPVVNMGLHFDGIGTLPRLKLRAPIARKLVLEAHRWTGPEAMEDGIVDALAQPEEMLQVALEMGAKWAPKAKMGVYALYRQELWGEATKAFQTISYVHGRPISTLVRAKV
ncbi:unnamed protein product [Penicillium olsonii]|uniref:Uncharacterized protein n=1 Tax=Penicillium olsonii TaxID=99116 RepID=A0A9W4IFV5_PENOL|nr:unnamed protein product [Penicillium olsonii]CAG8277103.1 unnamed protein product [Penicillium olsonii]